MNIAEELVAMVALVRAMHIGKDDGAALRVMDGNELRSVGIGALKLQTPWMGHRAIVTLVPHGLRSRPDWQAPTQQ